MRVGGGEDEVDGVGGGSQLEVLGAAGFQHELGHGAVMDEDAVGEVLRFPLHLEVEHECGSSTRGPFGGTAPDSFPAIVE